MWTPRLLGNLVLQTQKADPIRGSKHAAALVYRGDLVCYGHNRIKTHPIMLRYHREGQIFLHAEADALAKGLRLLGPEKLAECDLYVTRVTAKGNKMANSEPCTGCRRLINAMGIKGVYWT